MATVSVVTLAVLTVYIVAGLLTLARVPDPGGPGRRLVDLALWPAVAVRTAASPSRRHSRRATAEVATATVAPAAEPPAVPAVQSASPPAASPPAAETSQSSPTAPVGSAAAVPAAPPTPPPPDAVPASPPRDLRRDWEHFVLRLTEPSE